MIRELILFRPFFSLLLLLSFSPFCTYEPTSQIHPSLKQLEAEREQLISEKARFYEAYREAKKAWIELSNAQHNLESMLRQVERHQVQEGGLHDTDIAH